MRTSFLDPLTTGMQAVSDWYYLWVLLALLVAVGVIMTVRTRVLQVRHGGEMLRSVAGSRKGARDGISSFQAFAIGMATRIGIGNITGVALAVVLGGPGAVFWMWVVSIIGMATAFAEATLAQIFKNRAGDGTFRGGPAVYIARGVGSRTWGVVFAVLLIGSMALAMPMVQANSISATLDASHGVATWVTAILLAALTAVVVLGGVRKVARVAELLVPVMAAVYVVVAIVVVLLNAERVPAFLGDIVAGAFGLREGLAGIAGGVWAAVVNGVRRGLFSNEAGMGTNPNAAATATVTHPVRQGLVQAFGVFFDTFFVCTSTAFIILAAGPSVYVPGEGSPDDAGAMTSLAVVDQLGDWMAWPMTLVVLVFGFSSILGAYAYAEVALDHLGGRTRANRLLRVAAILSTGIGSILALELVWTLMDLAMALLTTVNLVALILLGRWVAHALKDYEVQRRAGAREPVYRIPDHPRVDDEMRAVWGAPAEDATGR